MSTVSVPTIDELAARKEEEHKELAEAVGRYKAVIRKIAGTESLCAATLIADGRSEEAILNLVSEASLLVRSDDFVEALSVYQTALRYANTDEMVTGINAAIVRLEGAVTALKVAKPVALVTDLVNKLGGEIVEAREGLPDTARFVNFTYKNIKFLVTCSNLFRLTTDLNDEGYDLTTIDRLEARILETVEKAQIVQSYSDWQDFDEDEDE